jgi:hypothetical protein
VGRDLNPRLQLGRNYHTYRAFEGEKAVDPILFANEAWPYMLGYKVDWTLGGKERPSIKLQLTMEASDKKERIQAIGRKLGALYLFAMLKTFKEQNPNWLEEVRSLFNCSPVTVAALDLDKMNKENIAGSHPIEKIGDQICFSLTPKDSEIKYAINEKKIDEFEKILVAIYPEEMKRFEKILADIKHKEGKTVTSNKDKEPKGVKQ